MLLAKQNNRAARLVDFVQLIQFKQPKTNQTNKKRCGHEADEEKQSSSKVDFCLVYTPSQNKQTTKTLIKQTNNETKKKESRNEVKEANKFGRFCLVYTHSQNKQTTKKLIKQTNKQ